MKQGRPSSRLIYARCDRKRALNWNLAVANPASERRSPSIHIDMRATARRNHTRGGCLVHRSHPSEPTRQQQFGTSGWLHLDRPSAPSGSTQSRGFRTAVRGACVAARS